MYNASGTNAYARVGVESAVMSASPHQLIVLLFDGAMSALVRARLFMQQGETVAKGEALSKAINIIDNGLKAGLDREQGASSPLTFRRCMTIWCVVCYRLIYVTTARQLKKLKGCSVISLMHGSKSPHSRLTPRSNINVAQRGVD